ncbi:leucyl aminopeptidase family protein [Wenzhouxiangella sp. XN24]|uniref:leucyl aminopeptidase family protein n=1 Tax=Wenzhouxiangella sp. XN24 TaxID=2713569 RepID=UPI0013EE1429|nr:leucyl aminopeptidase family protein [Wenzhouxiangella sp. XN24]NGX15730.1 leucyl aminopeptidase family protein [Wenzhouxiangella sp. XN24]
MSATQFYTDRAAGACPVHFVAADGLEGLLGKMTDAHRAWVRSTAWQPKPGAVLALPGNDGSVAAVVAGAGGDEPFWAIASVPGQLPPGSYVLAGDPDPAEGTRHALAWGIGQYGFSRRSKAPPVQARMLAWPRDVDPRAVISAVDADALVRDLVNTPAADMGPAELSQAAAALAAASGAEFREIVGDALLVENFPAIHAVGRASVRAPRLLDLRWGDTGRPRVTLVGKGVCFDTGGLNLKQPGGMRNMKKDMGGAAHVLGLAKMIMDAALPIRLRVLVPAVENSVAGNAYRPGDVVSTRAGLSVEIGNTDAEGRVVLADALALADEEAPELLLDFATLTGAARVALGPDLPALFASDDALARDWAQAGSSSGDPLWHMPLWAPYAANLSGGIADLNNVTTDGFAGAIYGGLFLQRFVSSAGAWAHVDTFAWNPRNRAGRPEGGMSQGVRAAFGMLASRYPA